MTAKPPPACLWSDVLLDTTEMYVEFVEVLQERAKGGAFGHFGKGVDILREAFAAIAELAIRSGDKGVCVVDIAGEEYAGVHFAPVGTHLLAVFLAGVEI